MCNDASKGVEEHAMTHQRAFNDTSKSVEGLGGACKTCVWRGVQRHMEERAMSMQRGRARGVESCPMMTREI